MVLLSVFLLNFEHKAIFLVKLSIFYDLHKALIILNNGNIKEGLFTPHHGEIKIKPNAEKF
jgi:hypothetical protein